LNMPPETTSTPLDNPRLELETLRLNERYLVEVVEAFGLCPWARGTRLSGNLARTVLLQSEEHTDHALARLQTWSEAPAVEIGLLIFPKLGLDYGDFQRFVNRLIDEDARRYSRASSPFAMAAFHPHAELDLGSPDRLVPYLRRSPDPTIQVVRVSALERVRGQEVAGTQFVDLKTFRLGALQTPQRTLRERISKHNFGTVNDDPNALTRALESIHAEHASVRERLARETLGSDDSQ
jgi:hypothetical protein